MSILYPETNSMTDEEKFHYLRKIWQEETIIHLPSPSQVENHTAFKCVLGMGKNAIAPILKHIRKTPDWSLAALPYITGADPVQLCHYGYITKIADDWVHWGISYGYIAPEGEQEFQICWKCEEKIWWDESQQKWFSRESEKCTVCRIGHNDHELRTHWGISNGLL